MKASSITQFKTVVTSLSLNVKLCVEDEIPFVDPTLYRCLIGKLNFLTNTGPDLAYAVQNLSQYMQCPRSSHWQALLHTLNYVNSTCGQGILLRGDTKLVLKAFSDSDWGACPNTQRFVSGYVLLLGKSPIS